MELKLIIVSTVFLLWTRYLISSANQKNCYAPMICDDGPAWINLTTWYQEELPNLLKRKFSNEIEKMTAEVAILQDRFTRMQKTRQDLQSVKQTTVETLSTSNTDPEKMTSQAAPRSSQTSKSPHLTEIFAKTSTQSATTSTRASIAIETSTITAEDASSSTPIVTSITGTSIISTNDPETTTSIATRMGETSTTTSSDVTSATLLAATVIQETSTKQRCPQTILTFPRDGKVEDYVLYNGSTVPQLTNIFICTWLTPPTGKVVGKGAVLSYYKYDSNDSFGNAMLIFFGPNNKLSVTTRGHWTSFRWDIQPVSDRTHFCFLISTVERKTEIFRNGKSLGQKNISSNAAVPAGGALVIGNDQNRADDPDAFLGLMEHPQDTFTGTIENLYIWNRNLGRDEIGELYNDTCACPLDHIIALTEQNVEKHGHVLVSSLRNDCN